MDRQICRHQRHFIFLGLHQSRRTKGLVNASSTDMVRSRTIKLLQFTFNSLAHCESVCLRP